MILTIDRLKIVLSLDEHCVPLRPRWYMRGSPLATVRCAGQFSPARGYGSTCRAGHGPGGRPHAPADGRRHLGVPRDGQGAYPTPGWCRRPHRPPSVLRGTPGRVGPDREPGSGEDWHGTERDGPDGNGMAQMGMVSCTGSRTAGWFPPVILSTSSSVGIASGLRTRSPPGW